MNYEIKCEPFPVLICRLGASESMNCQKGAMAWMTGNMKMETKTGGFGKMMSRAFSGESMFMNKYTAQGGDGEIAFSASVPGKILPIDVSARNIVAQKSAYLASTPNVETSIFFQKKLGSGFFGGEGFIMQKYSGSGMVFVEIDGGCVEYELAPGQSMLVDTGYLAAMDATCSMDIVSTGGVGNALFGGEGLFNTKITGPGHIWLQTMPLNALASSLSRYIVRG